MKRVLIALLIIASAASAGAQETFYSIFSFDGFIPSVELNRQTADLQSSLYPEYYAQNAVRSDIRWIARNDSLITSFWTEKKDTILHILSELSGLRWREESFDIYLLKYAPSFGSGDPLMLPLGGMMTGELIEAPPSENQLKFALLLQLSKSVAIMKPAVFHP